MLSSSPISAPMSARHRWMVWVGYELDAPDHTFDGAAATTELDSAQSLLPPPSQRTAIRRRCQISGLNLAIISAFLVCSTMGTGYRGAHLHGHTEARFPALQKKSFMMKSSMVTAGGSAGNSSTPQPPMLPPWLPEMYGKVREKTIWSFWYHPETCPSSANCTLPAHIQLCVETVEKHRGSFDYRIVHMDEVGKYVSKTELPVTFQIERVQRQKDSLMNALLARYGGVALDMSLILFRSLDGYWDEMVRSGATFRGYMYRLSGLRWAHPETCAVWFLMSRREGIFSTVVSTQVAAAAAWVKPEMVRSYRRPGLLKAGWRAFGDQMLTPVLSGLNYSLPKCYEDPSVPVREACPEYAAPPWYDGLAGPPRTDAKVLLREPRDGPQLPIQVDPSWHVNNSAPLPVPTLRTNNSTGCASMKQCWDVFLQRYHAPVASGTTTRTLNFVKMFGSGGGLWKLSRDEICADRSTYFYNWLKLAGIENC